MLLSRGMGNVKEITYTHANFKIILRQPLVSVLVWFGLIWFGGGWLFLFVCFGIWLGSEEWSMDFLISAQIINHTQKPEHFLGRWEKGRVKLPLSNREDLFPGGNK